MLLRFVNPIFCFLLNFCGSGTQGNVGVNTNNIAYCGWRGRGLKAGNILIAKAKIMHWLLVLNFCNVWGGARGGGGGD